MGLRIVDTATALLENSGSKTNKKALSAMRKGGGKIQDLAQQMAPIDKGNLEDAIITQEDRNGVNGRVRIFIGIDPSHSAGDGKNVGEYGELIHELLYPGGSWKLGKRSKEKQDANPGVQVGGQFIERALDELEDDIVKDIERAIKGSV